MKRPTISPDDGRHKKKGKPFSGKANVGGLVVNVPLDKDTARRLRTLALAQLGKADREACSKMIANLVGPAWQTFNDEIDAKAAALAEVEVTG